MKYKQFLLCAILTLFAVSLMIYPVSASAAITPNSGVSTSFTLLPPLCFVNEMYETEDENTEITPDEIISSDDVVVKVKFKLFDIIKDFFDKVFG